MGAAAEHRGNRLIRRQLDEEKRPVEFEMMDDLNALQKYDDAGMPFGPIHFVSSHGGWFAECPKTGFGYWYPSLREAVRSWNVVVNGYDSGRWLAVPFSR